MLKDIFQFKSCVKQHSYISGCFSGTKSVISVNKDLKTQSSCPKSRITVAGKMFLLRYRGQFYRHHKNQIIPPACALLIVSVRHREPRKKRVDNLWRHTVAFGCGIACHLVGSMSTVGQSQSGTATSAVIVSSPTSISKTACKYKPESTG